MSQTETLALMQQTLWTAVQLGGPVLLTALVVGVAISLIQAVTQVNEQSLNFVPKVLAVIIVLVLIGPWMIQTLIEFTARLYSSIPMLVH
jgi:flagellar biosynthesis protein FliQ